MGAGFQGYGDQKNARHKLPAHTPPPTLLSTAHLPKIFRNTGVDNGLPKMYEMGAQVILFNY